MDASAIENEVSVITRDERLLRRLNELGGRRAVLVGVFNSITTNNNCPHCGVVVEREGHFRFGYTRQLTYRVGERLRWTGTRSDVGSPQRGAVIAYGYLGPCPNCGFEEGDCEVCILDDVLINVRLWTGRYDFRADEDYVSVKPLKIFE